MSAMGVLWANVIILWAYVICMSWRLDRKVERRLQRLEKYAHRHVNFQGLGNCGRDVAPEACDHGYKDWDDCPVCCH